MAASSEHIYGDVEVDFSDCEENDLHKHTPCKKNPGHTKFIPVDEFRIEHMQENLRDPLVYDFIKATADLTVRISVGIVSPDRPEFWPKSDIQYPLYKMRGKKKSLVGSGIIETITKYLEGQCDDKFLYLKNKQYKTCPCAKCKESEIPSKVWWEIQVFTAMHVVFDNAELEHTFVRLFFDRKDSPKIIVDPVVDKLAVEKEKAKYAIAKSESQKHWLRGASLDGFSFQCATCDESLAKILEDMTRQRKMLANAVHHKYLDSRTVDKFNFIVSHPHGRSKQVSVGNWNEIQYPSDPCKGRFTYSTCTCPGSSGALVVNLGYRQECHPHTGSLKGSFNYSGGGMIISDSMIAKSKQILQNQTLQLQNGLEKLKKITFSNIKDDDTDNEDTSQN